MPTGALMVCGTTSNAGKSTLVAGLCRVLARQGVKVAPFKAQNMALNSAVTPSGHEIGRAQAAQAAAARATPEVAMNPILLKPTAERTSQVIVLGEPRGVMSAVEYHELKPALLELVLDQLADLRSRFDVVLLEGAGSPAEINLLDNDIVNLRVAQRARIPAVVIGDIDLGGVFAALFGTVELLPAELRAQVRGFVINKFRGDPALLYDGTAHLQARCGVPTLGVVPWVEGADIDTEDSMALSRPTTSTHTVEGPGDLIDVAVIRFPRISNFTDLDALGVEPGVGVRFVADVAGLGRPDLVILPGTKSTVDDLAWLRARGLPAAIERSGATILGICGGYQMLGHTISDGVESSVETVDGLGWLPVHTSFHLSKVTRQRRGVALGHPVAGYQIHHGRVQPYGGAPFVELDDGTIDGVATSNVAGTTLHGLFDNDDLRRDFLSEVGRVAGKRFISDGTPFDDRREARFDALADALEAHLDLDAIESLIDSAGVPR